jgi:hypothetical protein
LGKKSASEIAVRKAALMPINQVYIRKKVEIRKPYPNSQYIDAA